MPPSCLGAPAGVNVSLGGLGLRRGGLAAALRNESRADLLREAPELRDQDAPGSVLPFARPPRDDPQGLEAAQHRRERALGINQEFAAADVLELPSEALEDRLARHCLRDPLERQVAIA